MAGTSSRQITNICVFCGYDFGNSSKFVEAAQKLGRVMAKRKMHLVYGSGNLELMGAISKAVKERGSLVLGIIPKSFDNEILIGKTNGEKYIVSGMSERFTEMINHVDAFIALPSGLSTLEDIITVASWANLDIHSKPIRLLIVNHFFDFLLVFLDDAKRLGFISKSTSDIFPLAERVDDLIDQLLAYEPKIDPILSKLDWSDNDRSKKCRLDLNFSM